VGRFVLFLFRLFAVTVGFVFACLVAACVSLVLNSMIVPGGLVQLQARGLDSRLVIGLVGLAAVFGQAAFLPSIAMIFLGEFTRARSWIAYMLGGGVIAGVVLALALREGVAISLEPRHLAIDLVAGMLGGFGYWLIAGHRAGRWLPSEAGAADPRESAG